MISFNTIKKLPCYFAEELWHLFVWLYYITKHAYGASKRLFLLRDCQETVAWIFFYNTIFWQITWSALLVLLNLSEEIDGLSLAAAQSYVSLMQVVCDAL